MKNPLVSVVIPVYNVENYLNKCIDSVVNQTYSNLEIILIDDGSTDRCPEICENWSRKDNRFKVVHKTNSGAGMSRNSGIELATGEYIFFVDSDDYLDLNTVEKCLLKAMETAADLIIFGKNECYENSIIKAIPFHTQKLLYEGYEVTEMVLPSLLTYKMGVGISVWGKMYKLSVIKDNNVTFLSEREIFSEDAYFTLMIFGYLNSVAILEENLYYYRKNNNSYTQKLKENHQKLNDSFLKKSISLCEQNNYPSVIKNCVYTRYQMFTLAGMKQILNTKQSVKAKYSLLKSFFKNKTLLNTLKKDVLKSQNFLSKIFWRFLKLKLYHICYILLWYKACK